jgi:hypothetical protein
VSLTPGVQSFDPLPLRLILIQYSAIRGTSGTACVTSLSSHEPADRAAALSQRIDPQVHLRADRRTTRVERSQNLLGSWKEHLDHFVLVTLDLANNPGKDIVHWYVFHSTSMDLASPISYFSSQRVRVLGILTGIEFSTRLPSFLSEIDFDEVPSPQFGPRDDRW